MHCLKYVSSMEISSSSKRLAPASAMTPLLPRPMPWYPHRGHFGDVWCLHGGFINGFDPPQTKQTLLVHVFRTKMLCILDLEPPVKKHSKTQASRRATKQKAHQICEDDFGKPWNILASAPFPLHTHPCSRPTCRGTYWFPGIGAPSWKGHAAQSAGTQKQENHDEIYT